MTLLDAYALAAFLVGGPAAPSVRVILREGNAAVATANLAEALDVAERVHGLPIDEAVATIEPLLDEALATRPLGAEVAVRAARLRATHYHRTRCRISLADAVLIASAAPGDRIATADRDVIRVARAEGIEPVELPSQDA